MLIIWPAVDCPSVRVSVPVAPPRVTVPEEDKPVKPEAAPALVTIKVGDFIKSVAKVPLIFMPLVTVPLL